MTTTDSPATKLTTPTSLDGLRDLLRCPSCKDGLQWSETRVTCNACRDEFELRDGIAVLVPPAARQDRHKRSQARSHDQQDWPKFEMTRPNGTPSFYAWLMNEKFRRGTLGLERLLPGATAVTLCGGSGMDADLLARSGAAAISADISFGAAVRARERAERFALPILSVVADCEHLPLADRSVDLAYVHDGLHHLQLPSAGVSEMTRVARRAVSVTEPARAAITALSVKLGVSVNVEDAGNRVARMTLDEVLDQICEAGFKPIDPHRYGMYYRHVPGPIARGLSRTRLQPLGRSAFALANRAAGRWGNKLAVQALR